MKFRGEYYFLSNMYPCLVRVDGRIFRSAEAAFQSRKCLIPEETAAFQGLDGFQAKKLGRYVKLRPDWNDIRLAEMEKVLRQKFRNQLLLSQLKEISGPIVEDNDWGDTFWGCCRGTGQNHLGKLLMKIRDEA